MHFLIRIVVGLAVRSAQDGKPLPSHPWEACANYNHKILALSNLFF